jgi:hypothetical protein
VLRNQLATTGEQSETARAYLERLELAERELATAGERAKVRAGAQRWSDANTRNYRDLYAQINPVFANLLNHNNEFHELIRTERHNEYPVSPTNTCAELNMSMFCELNSALGRLESLFQGDDDRTVIFYKQGLKRMRSECAVTVQNILGSATPELISNHIESDKCDIKLPGVGLNSFDFSKALKEGGYGDYDLRQPKRVVNRLGELIEKCEKRQKAPEPIEIAYVIYRTGWGDAGRKQVFDHLKDIGAISQEIYQAGIGLIDSNGGQYADFTARREQGALTATQGDGRAMGTQSQDAVPVPAEPITDGIVVNQSEEIRLDGMQTV